MAPTLRDGAKLSRHLGFQAGSHRLSQDIDVTDPDHFTSDAVSEFFDVGGNSTGEGCATAVGQRFE